MSYDSSDIIRTDWGFDPITLSGSGDRHFLQNGADTRSFGFGDVSVVIFMSDGEWNSGDEVGNTYNLRGEPPTVPDDNYQFSDIKKVGKLPIGAITDEQGWAYDIDWFDEFSPYGDGPTGDRDNTEFRIGNIKFLPDAQFKNGNAGLKGKLPKADEFDEGPGGLGFGMGYLIFSHSELQSYTYAANIGPYTGNTGSGQPLISPRHDRSPQRGHIIRLCLFRWRWLFN